jgi:hypothetical protein
MSIQQIKHFLNYCNLTIQLYVMWLHSLLLYTAVCSPVITMHRFGLVHRLV